MRELGRVAAKYFDEVIVREDRNLSRSRARRGGGDLIMEGIDEARSAAHGSGTPR